MVQDFKLLQEISTIISEIEAEVNQLDSKARKQLANSVYTLGNNYLSTNSESARKGDKYYAFVIKKSFWLNKLSLELRGSFSISEHPNELAKVNYKTDDYRLYKNKENLYIFDIESLVKIKRFLLAFAE